MQNEECTFKMYYSLPARTSYLKSDSKYTLQRIATSNNNNNNNNNIYLKSNIHKMFSRLLYNTHIKCSI